MSNAKPPEELAYEPLRDKDGNVKVNQFGHIVSARLTVEQEARIDELVAEGLTHTAIAKAIRSTTTRVQTYLHKPKVAERIALLFQIKVQAQALEAMQNKLLGMTALLQKMESRMSEIQTTMQRVSMNTRRQKIGRATAEKAARSQRHEVTKLKRALWSKSGLRS